MQHITSLGGRFEADVQLDFNGSAYIGYLGSDSGMILQAAVAETVLFTVRVSVSGSDLRQASYYSDPSGRLELSIRKYLDVAGAGNYCVILVTATVGGVDDRMLFGPNVKEGVSYTDIIAPTHKGMDEFVNGLSCHTVVPPNVIMQTELIGGSVNAETSLSNIAMLEPSEGVWEGLFGATWETIVVGGSRHNELAVSGKYTHIRFTEDGVQRQWELCKTDDCADVCMLQWTSRTGAVRRHVFAVKEIETDVEDMAELMVVGDGYRAVKNTSTAFKVYIDGLTPYSWWYYADMVAASDLQCLVPEDGHYFGDGMCHAVCVDTQKTTPNVNGFVTFEATIKWRSKDAY